MPEDPIGSVEPSAQPPSRSELAEFESGDVGQPEPTSPPEPTEAAPASTPDPAAPGKTSAAREPSVKPTAPPAAAEKKFRFGDHEYSLAELTARPDLLEAIAITAGKYPSVNDKYQELLERMTKPAEKPAADQPKPVQATAAHYDAAFGARAKELAASGLIEEDAVAAFPNFVNQGIAMAADVQRLSTGFEAVRDFLLQLADGNKRSSVEQVLESVTDGLANSGDELYAPLADRAEGGERAKFYDFLINQVNPPVRLLTPEFLAAQWFAYKQKDLAATLQNARNAAATTSETRRRQAGGVPPAPRGPQPRVSTLEQELRDFEANA